MRMVSLSHLLGDLENSQKSQRPQHTDAKRHARPEEAPNHLEDAADDDLQNMSNSRKDYLILTQIIQIIRNINLMVFFSFDCQENKLISQCTQAATLTAASTNKCSGVKSILFASKMQ